MRVCLVAMLWVTGCGGAPGGASGSGGNAGSGGGGAGGAPALAMDSALRVLSAGDAIGWVENVGPYHVTVWDPDAEVRFSLNLQTGFLMGPARLYFESSDCTGTGYLWAEESECSASDAGITAPLFRYVLADSEDPGGWEKGLRAVTTTSAAQRVYWMSYFSGTACVSVQNMTLDCVYPFAETTVVPLEFPTPIEIDFP